MGKVVMYASVDGFIGWDGKPQGGIDHVVVVTHRPKPVIQGNRVPHLRYRCVADRGRQPTPQAWRRVMTGRAMCAEKRLPIYCRRCIRAAWSAVMRVLINGFWSRSTDRGGRHSGSAVSVDAAGPAAGREIVMVINAKQSEIVQIGRPAVDPGNDVVPLGPFRCSIATGKAAAAVAGDQRGGLAAAGDASGPAQVQHDPVAVQERVVRLGLISHAAYLVGGDQGAVGGDDRSRCRSSRSSISMVMITVAGVPPDSGIVSERRSRSQTSSSASCIRCP